MSLVTAPKRFAEKTIVITGGTSGIGLTTARRILSEGGQVLVTGHDQAKIAALPRDIPGLQIDATDLTSAATLAHVLGRF